MWIDRDGCAHVEDQYDPTTWADFPGNRGDVDWPATERYRKEQEGKGWN